MKSQTKTLILAVTIIALAGSVTLAADTKITVIPKPMETKLTDGHFTLKQTSAIYYEDAGPDAAEIKAVAKYLRKISRRTTQATNRPGSAGAAALARRPSTRHRPNHSQYKN